MLGHRVLETTNPLPTTNSEQVEVAIVGSGIAGLSAAWWLERQRRTQYVVLELESLAGGTACYGTDAIVRYPWAAHYIPVPDPNNATLRTLLEEVGAFERDASGRVQPAETVLVRAPDERLFVGDHWVSGLVPMELMTASDRRDFERFEQCVRLWVEYRDSSGRRAFALPIERCSPNAPWVEFDKVSAAQWLHEQGFRSPILLWWLNYGCRDDYGCTLETTSAWAMMLYHAARVADAGQPSAPFLTWPEGNGRLVRHFERIVGTRLRRQQLVTSVESLPDRAKLNVLRSDGTRYTLRAHRVILAVPHFITERMIAPQASDHQPQGRPFSYAPWLVANIHLSNRPRNTGFAQAWDNVILDSPSLGYVVATHQVLLDDGPTVFTYYLPFTDADPIAARQRLLAGNHESLCDAIVADLVRAHPDLPELVTRIDIWRWGHAMVRPAPGVIWGGSRLEASKPQGRIHFAHTELSGVALFEEAHSHGVRAAKEVLAQLDQAPNIG